MKIRIGMIAVILVIAALSSVAIADETYFKFSIDSPDELRKLTRVISIDNVVGKEVYAYANERELDQFRALGYTYEELQHPSTLIQPKMAADKRGMDEWDSYPTYEAYVSMMYQFETDYPLICDVQTIGYSVEGRELIFAKISANVDVDEDEPEVCYSSTMHGNEICGYVLMLRLIDSLLTGYTAADPRIVDMVDNMEIWINPLANPDGTYHGGNNTVSGATRYNANGVDPNRNFPDPEDGPHPDGYSWQPETVAMMDLAEAQRLVLSVNYHTGAEVVNYPWDTWSQRHADDQWFQDISHEYADTVHAYSSSYMTGFDDGITNGYDWYTIYGGRQDYMTYFRGGREVTIELSNAQMLPASQLPAHWEYNKRSFLAYFENALFGIRGIVTDAITGDPVDAVITVVGHDIDSARVFTDPDVGDYYRMIESGTWSLEFTALGYVPQTVSGIIVIDGSATIVDVQLEPISDEPVLDMVGHDAGAVDPGDIVSMYIALVNDGGGDALGVSATLATDDPYVNILQSVSTYPLIPKLGGEATSNSAYEFEVLSSCPLYHTVDFDLYMTASGGYADTASFQMLIGQELENFESGSFASYPWEMTGNQPWTVTSSDVYEGTYCSKSGNINDNQTSTISVTLNVLQSNSITFYYKVSSESNYDYLRFYIDGSEKGEWSGSVGWTKATYSVNAGTRTFKWTYSKDGSISNGSDCGWVDYIVFPASGIPVEITTMSLPDWTVGYAYSQQLEASGGSGSLTWSDLNNDLDGTGLTLSITGLLSGSPTSSGQTSFTAHVEDQVGGYDTKLFSFTINSAPEITTVSLPDWTVGVEYSQQLASTGGTGTKTWNDANSGLFGTELALSASGVVSGTALTSGTISFQARVTDQIGAFDESPYSFTINPELQIMTTELPDATVDVPYSTQLESTGGTGQDTWADLSGDLAGSGLSVSEDGMVSGTPAAAGQLSFTAVAQDQIGAEAQKPLTIEVLAGWVCGDADGSGAVDIDDVVYLIGFIFGGGSVPEPYESGDVDCSGAIDIDDVVYLISYIFASGPVPCDGC
jgi:hypothetical protein